MKEKRPRFSKYKKYLSKVIADAQLEYTEANKLIQRFKIKHTLLMNISPLSNNNDTTKPLGSIETSPFARELIKEIAYLSQLEKSLSLSKKAMLKLSGPEQLEQDDIEEIITTTEIQEVLSATFFKSVLKINDASISKSFKNQEIKKFVNQELKTLKQQIQALEDKISKREDQTKELMTIENRFQELAVDVAKKKLIFEGLKDQLKEKILSTGLANVQQPVLLTSAVPPFTRDAPNKKLIVLLGILLSVFSGIAYILIRQPVLRRIHSPSQLRRLSRFLNCYRIKYKQLKEWDNRNDETVVSQSFFSLTKEMGKLGCVIDLSKKRLNNSLASKFSKTVASILAADGSDIVCLDTLSNKKLFSFSLQQNLVSDFSDYDAKGMTNERNFTLNDEDGMINDGEIKKIKNKYSDYDKIICALGGEISELTKFKFIEQCDFYILIGRSFYFDEHTYKKFSNTVWEKEKKCVGLFLID